MDSSLGMLDQACNAIVCGCWCAQARHCYTRYNEFYRCQAERGEDAPECSVFQRAYRSICPSEWLERWNEQREEGTWPGRY